MFNTVEAVDTLIDEINELYSESYYDEIYNELCERVNIGVLTLEEAELINEVAYEKYVTEKQKLTPEQRKLKKDAKEQILDNQLRKDNRRGVTGMGYPAESSGMAVKDYVDVINRDHPDGKKYHSHGTAQDKRISSKRYYADPSNHGPILGGDKLIYQKYNDDSKAHRDADMDIYRNMHITNKYGISTYKATKRREALNESSRKHHQHFKKLSISNRLLADGKAHIDDSGKLVTDFKHTPNKSFKLKDVEY